MATDRDAELETWSLVELIPAPDDALCQRIVDLMALGNEAIDVPSIGGEVE